MQIMKKTWAVLAGIIAVVAFGGTVFASVSQFIGGAATTSDQAATTTLRFMTPGTATTTVVYDTRGVSGTNQTNNGSTNATDQVTLLTYLNASSTATVLTIAFEYSQDGISWYQDNTETYAAGAIAIATPNTYTWTYASTTPGGGVASGNLGAKAITIDVPTRFVRVFYGMTGANGAVHGRFVPMSEKSE